MKALLTLFIISSKDGWVQIMYNGIDAVDVDMQPIRNYSEAKLIYFTSFILVVSFFVLNMFVGVVVRNFQDCREQQIREQAAKQEEYLEKNGRKQRLMREIPYYAHFSPWRKRLHDLCTSKYFDLTIAAIIGLNVATMSLEFYHMPPVRRYISDSLVVCIVVLFYFQNLANFLEYCNYVFTVVFLFEFIGRIIALGPSRYFKDKYRNS
jgi:voltage-dependent calcium channel T type alpha-1H